MVPPTEANSEFDGEDVPPGVLEDTTGILSALFASSCCWIPALAALLGFSAAGLGVGIMAFHTPLAFLGLALIGWSWYRFLGRRWTGERAWRRGYLHWGILTVSSTVVLLYTVAGWFFPSLMVYLT